MKMQKHFLNFNDEIRMDYNTNSELKDKRDILLKKLRDSGELPSFNELNQGSYIMYTGVKPLNGEYDIDVGLRFNVNKDDYRPTELKNKIDKILENHTEYGAEIKKPCVTITYKKDGELAYHVDLVVYTYEDRKNKDSQLYLARGKDSSPSEICWEKSDPKGLVDYINNKYNDNSDDKDQYRRVIRYIKRWTDLKFSSKGNAKPPSIGLTLIAANHFKVSKQYKYLEERYIYNDLQALINFVEVIQKLFFFKDYSDTGRELYRLNCFLPSELKFEVNVDVFEKMSDNYMTDFKTKIDRLVQDLDSVEEETSEREKCKKLNQIFGDDFKIPEEENMYVRHKNSLPNYSASGMM